jgi:chromosomal replication initiation ATPase DnaA
MSATRQIPLPLPHDAAMGVDDFLVTASNHEAAAWIAKWPDWPVHGLILTGDEGSGKTHLLNLWLQKSGGRLVTVGELVAQDARMLTLQTRCIAIDDAETIAGKKSAEENLFHLFNHLKSTGGSLLLTMLQSAGYSGFTLPDLHSRLLSLPTAALAAPDDELLSALIVKQFRDRQVTLDSGVVAYIAARVARDAASIRDLVERLDHVALAEGRKVTIASARKILGGGDD